MSVMLRRRFLLGAAGLVAGCGLVPDVSQPLTLYTLKPKLTPQTLPKVALEIGADLPDLSQVADVVDLEPKFRMSATGSLVDVHVALEAIYGDTEVEVRADGARRAEVGEPAGWGLDRVRLLVADDAGSAVEPAVSRSSAPAPSEQAGRSRS